MAQFRVVYVDGSAEEVTADSYSNSEDRRWVIFKDRDPAGLGPETTSLRLPAITVRKVEPIPATGTPVPFERRATTFDNIVRYGQPAIDGHDWEPARGDSLSAERAFSCFPDAVVITVEYTNPEQFVQYKRKF